MSRAALPWWAGLLLLALVPPVLASGWNDYSLTIDPRYEIVRANSLDVVLCRTGGQFGTQVVLMPQTFPGLGPINAYALTPTHVLTRHFGRLPRNRFAGDTFEEVDRTKTYYCLTRRSDDSVVGPLGKAAFLARPEVAGATPVAWTEPSNPNVATPLIGGATFLGITALIFVGPFVGLAVLVGAGILLWRHHGRRSVS